jgi:hypothetical protein
MARRAHKVEWRLDLEDYKYLASQDCYFCGRPPANNLVKAVGPSYREFDASLKYQGIDRLDATIGYTKQNTVPCCWTCNRIKGRLSIRGLCWHIQKMLPKLTALALSRSKTRNGRAVMALISELEDEITALSGVIR